MEVTTSLSGVDYEQSLFPSLVRRASEKKSARKINRRRAKTLADLLSLARRTKLLGGKERSNK